MSYFKKEKGFNQSPMNILIVGNGGREHAIAESVIKSKHTKKLYIAPGNPGISKIGKCIDIQINDIKKICNFAKETFIDLVIIGPEIPLVLGLKDELSKMSIKAFGPSADAAKLEGSKTFSRNFCKRYNIPQPKFKYFTDICLAYDEIERLKGFCVVKADGLAAGKGVSVCDNVNSAKLACDEILKDKKFGESGKKLLIEERIEGQEASLFVVSDGDNYQLVGTAQDHKRAFDGNKGPNTGGMGAISPAPNLNTKLTQEILNKIISPTIKGMKEENRPYEGILYAGIMLTRDGPKLIEYNCRFGDPEAQVLLPLLETDIIEIILKSINKKIKNFNVHIKKKNVINVVLATRGYPGKFKKNIKLPDLNPPENQEILKIFHAGTSLNQKKELVATGGRVLSITAISKTISDCRKRAYDQLKKINWSRGFYRKDIGKS